MKVFFNFFIARSAFYLPIILSILAVWAVWVLFLAPRLTALPPDYYYSAAVSSVDNFYDEESQSYLGEQYSVTNFAFNTISSNAETEDIKVSFDVSTPEGVPIISLSRVYGIDRKTRMHNPEAGDRERHGYMFAPRFLTEDSTFDYWHINYDGPATMHFVEREVIYGVETFHFRSTYDGVTIDQTANLTNLPGVPEERGVVLEPTLDIWVEPVSGFLVKYRDDTYAYYYDIETGEKIAPWNHFQNVYSEESVAAMAIQGLERRYQVSLAYIYVPYALGFSIFCLLVLYLMGPILQSLLVRYRLITPLILLFVALFSFILTTIIVAVVDYNIRIQSRLAFESQVNQITAYMKSRMELYNNLSYGLQGLFGASNEVEESEWQEYVAELEIPDHYSGISGISFALKVASSSLSSLEFEVTPPQEKDYYYPILYWTTFNETSNSPLGFDLSSEAERKRALTIATERDEPTATKAVTGALSGITIFSIYAPIYQNDTEHKSLSGRKQNVAGIVATSFRVEQLFEGLLDDISFNEDINIEIFDTVDPNNMNEGSLLYSTGKAFDSVDENILTQISTVPVAGRIWIFRYQIEETTNLPLFERYATSIVSAGGVLLTLILLLFTWRYIRARERELAYKNQQIQKLIENFPYGVLIESVDRKILLANSNLITLFGGKENKVDLVGMDTRVAAETISKSIKGYKKYIERIEDIIRRQNPVIDDKVQLTNGKVLNRSYMPLFDGKRFNGGLWTFKDITEREKVDEMKSDFVSLVSHQLKTPVAQIRGYVANMIDGLTGNLNEKQISYLHDMDDVARTNGELIDDLLNVSRIERGILTINKEKVSLARLMEDTVKVLSLFAKEQGVELEVQYPKKDTNVLVDKAKTIQAIRNIIHNAIKFTPSGKKVSVNTNLTKDGVEVVVADQGIGIDKDVQAELFEKERVWAGKVKAAGAGLGLYLTKKFITLQGGKISFTTSPKGTIFNIILPKYEKSKIVDGRR